MSDQTKLRAEVERLRDRRAFWINEAAEQERRAESAEARVRELEAALQQSRLATVEDQANRLAETLTEETAKRRAAVEKLRAVEALADLGVREHWTPDEFRAGIRRLASPVESDAEDAK